MGTDGTGDGDGRDVDEKVGYGRPPKKHQFKPGRSGNPRGRPKGAFSDATILKRELAGLVRVMEGGRSRAISKRELFYSKLVAEAIKGNSRDRDLLLKVQHMLDLGIKPAEPETDISEQERLTLDHHIARLIARQKKKK